MHWPGIEPGPPAWQASILPLNHQCFHVAYHYVLLKLDTQEKLYQEINSVLKPNEPITEDHLAKLKYLKYTVKENFR